MARSEADREVPAPPAQSHRPGWWAGAPGVAAVSLVATVLSWRTSAWAKVAPGLDPSWQAGLAEGFERHLQWGPGIIFTFGPYGLVDTVLPFYRLTVFLAVLFAFIVSWGLAALMVAAARPAWGLVPAGAVAWLALAVANSHTGYADLLSAAALGLALVALGSERAGRRQAAVVVLGALAGLALLVKFNDGLVACGLLAVAVVAEGAACGARALWRATAGLGALAGAVVVAWAGAGQGLANLPGYFRASFSVAAGYTSAMSLSVGRRAEDYFAVVVAMVLGLVFYLAARSSRAKVDEDVPPGATTVDVRPVDVCPVDVRPVDVPPVGPAGLGGAGRRLRPGRRGNAPSGALGARGLRVSQVALAVSLAGWAWATLKEGFVRHDTHDLTFFGLVLVATALARVGRRYLFVQVGALAVAASLACVAAGAPPAELRSPAASTAALATDLRVALGLGGFRPAQAELHAHLLAAGNGLPASVLSLVKGRSVAIEPAEEAAAYLYPQLHWDPEPVLQGYSAYTDYLDGLGSKFLGSARAPERIVYDPKQVIEGSDPWMSPPATLLSMYCHYAQLAVAGPWQVLGRVRYRCGPARLVGTVRAHFGEPVAVPEEGGQLVAARFSFGLPLLSRLEGVLLKPPAVSIVVRAGGRRGRVLRRAYRFVPGTAGDMHVLVAPASLGYSPAFTTPAVRQLELEGGGWAGGQGRVTVRFYAIRLSRPPRG